MPNTSTTPNLFNRVKTRIEQSLRESEIPVSRSTESELIVEPSQRGGFEVFLFEWGDEVLIGWGEGHDHTRDEDTAVSLFLLGLTDRARLVVHRRGATTVKTTMQRREGDGWTDELRSGLIFSPFWRRMSVEILQNHRVLRRPV